MTIQHDIILNFIIFLSWFKAIIWLAELSLGRCILKEHTQTAWLPLQHDNGFVCLLLPAYDTVCILYVAYCHKLQIVSSVWAAVKIVLKTLSLCLSFTLIHTHALYSYALFINIQISNILLIIASVWKHEYFFFWLNCTLENDYQIFSLIRTAFILFHLSKQKAQQKRLKGRMKALLMRRKVIFVLVPWK